MKKLLSMLLAVAMSIAFFTGCAKDGFQGDSISINNSADTVLTDPVGIDAHDVSDSALVRAEQLVDEDGVYVTPAMVAAYIDAFNKLPSNFITKKEAQQLGWDSSINYVSDVAEGKSIGGDYFGNYENKLPKGSYHECDINYTGGRRGAERIIYSSKGDIYYTSDHYNSFEKLY